MIWLFTDTTDHVLVVYNVRIHQGLLIKFSCDSYENLTA